MESNLRGEHEMVDLGDEFGVNVSIYWSVIVEVADLTHHSWSWLIIAAVVSVLRLLASYDSSSIPCHSFSCIWPLAWITAGWVSDNLNPLSIVDVSRTSLVNADWSNMGWFCWLIKSTGFCLATQRSQVGCNSHYCIQFALICSMLCLCNGSSPAACYHMRCSAFLWPDHYCISCNLAWFETMSPTRKEGQPWCRDDSRRGDWCD